MNTAAKREAVSGTPGCGGDGCNSRDPWPLHHVRHRSVFCRLCTSCVLRYHPGAFCSACFDVLDSSPPPDRPLVHCAKCPAVAHLACLPDSTAHYLCPSCSKPHGFSYFAADSSPLNPADDPPLPEGRRRAIDLPSAKVLLAAARLAAASMTRAIAAARSDAERKVREAALARKRAREMLERSLSISSKEREKAKERETPTLAAEPKKKSPRMSDALSAQRTAQDRNRGKWMRFHEPIQVVRSSPAAHSIVENDANKGHPVNSIQNHVTPDLKDQASSISHIPTNANPEESEKEMKGHHPGSQDATGVKEDIRAVEPDNGHPIPQQTQDASVSRMNNGSTLAGLPSTASLHS